VKCIRVSASTRFLAPAAQEGLVQGVVKDTDPSVVVEESCGDGRSCLAPVSGVQAPPPGFGSGKEHGVAFEIGGRAE